MNKIRVNTDTEITQEVIEYVINEHKEEKARVEKLNNYYKGKNDILDRVYDDPKKPQNKLSNPYATYITNMAVGYFLGNPITYKYNDDSLEETLSQVLKYNDENDINTTLAKQASIQGYAVELLYADEEANVRFKPIPANEIALVFDNTLEENLLFVVRYYTETNIETQQDYTVVEVYDKEKISYYDMQGSTVQFKGEVPHYFNDVPCVIYNNNDEMLGDFERVLSLIDAYDKTQSDSANDFEYFTDCMLVVSGYVLAEDDAESISNKRTINFSDSTGKAEYLIKNIQDTALENYKNRLDNDIHKFSQIPNLSDENFSNNASGVALQFKLMGIENITSVKESKFKKGILRRLELLCNYYRIKTNKNLNYLDAEPIFTRTKPRNDLEIAQMMQTLTGILSEETILSLSPFVTDVKAEMERKEEESNNQYPDNYSNFNNEKENDEEDEKKLGDEDVS